MSTTEKDGISYPDRYQESQGHQVTRMEVSKDLGLRRVVWDLRPEAQGNAGGRGGRGGGRGGVPMVPAGRYTATLQSIVGENITELGPPQSFDVVPLPEQNYKLYR